MANEITVGQMFENQIANATTDAERLEAMFQRARYRVEHVDRLQPLADVILDNGWDDDQEAHLEWVVNAPVDEIVAWAEDVSRDW